MGMIWLLPIPLLWMKVATRKLTGFKSNPVEWLIVDAEKCAQLKDSLKQDCLFLSTNDVITAAMAEVLPGSKTHFLRNTRNRAPGIESHTGGNHFGNMIGSLAGDPAAVRKLVSTSGTPLYPLSMGWNL